MTGREQIAVVGHVPLCRRNGSSITKNCPKSSRAFWLSGCGIYAVKAADAPGVSVRTGYSRQERWNADGLLPGYAGSPAGTVPGRSCMGENDEEEGSGLAGGTLYINRYHMGMFIFNGTRNILVL